MKTFNSLLLATVILLGVSCKKDTKDPDPVPEPTPQPQTTTIKLGFANMVGTLPLVFNQDFVNPKGDTFKVTKFNYYISNIVFTKSDNTTYSEPSSYHLIKHSTPSTTLITVNNVPKGIYKSVSFMLGVDSASNCSGAQAGDLEVSTAADMFWSWSTGYIMLKLEGTAPKSAVTNKMIEYHIGGYGGVNKTQRSFNINFYNGTVTIDATPGTTPQINMKVDVNEFFKTPTLIDFTTQHTQTSAGPAAKTFADNYADMISFGSIQ